ncbi:uncharacterized protein LOC143221792 [Lasioglossum baleicum]|uniref:uncharacterized protein LOC143221792 n=1 Tax=Lasioglossum baleicum TaxID=434251 RepID=UPI003FCE8579
MNESTQAISFANCYFSLVDGLASGFEDHLAEDVLLDWFGKTIRGRKNVAAFMEAYKVTSRHIFKTIVPSSDIGYKKKSTKRKNDFDKNDQSPDVSTIEEAKCVKKETFPEADTFMATDVIVDHNQNEINQKKIAVAIEDDYDMSYYLNEGDLSNLFKLEILSTNIEEIEQSINRIKLEEEMSSTIKVIKRECGQEDGSVIVESGTVKYVEADGEITFSRKAWKRDGWISYSSAVTRVHKWRRPCKLQIAYSTVTERPALEKPPKNSAAYLSQPKARLLSLEEINELSNRLVPNKNDFNGFLKEFDFFKDREGFLNSLETELMTKDSLTPSIIPGYVKNKLVFNKRYDVNDKNDRDKRQFVCNYQIHLIIYESVDKSRENLRELEDKKSEKSEEKEILETVDGDKVILVDILCENANRSRVNHLQVFKDEGTSQEGNFRN